MMHIYVSDCVCYMHMNTNVYRVKLSNALGVGVTGSSCKQHDVGAGN